MPKRGSAGGALFIPYDSSDRVLPHHCPLMSSPALIWAASRRVPCLRTHLAEQRDHPPVERREVVGLAARHQVAVDRDLLIHPCRPGVPEIALERSQGGD